MYQLLQGFRIIEGAAFIAAPSCGLYFTQLGADVIRFENLGGGPDFRRWPISKHGDSFYWEGLNRGKRSVALDLSQPAGRELAQRLATTPGPDTAFVTNFPADGFLGHDTLRRMRDDLVCCRVMGWADGRPAVDYTVNAAVGVPLMTGPVWAEGPVNHVLPAWDLLTGAYAAFALMAALRDRSRGGGGREIRIALSDIAATSLANLGFVAETLAGDGPRRRMGNDLYGAFGRDFLTRDGSRIMVVALTSRQWAGLVGVLGLQEAIGALAAELGADFDRDEAQRFVHRERLFPLFEAAFSRRRLDSLVQPFEAAGVCWSRFETLEAALRTPGLFRDNPVFARASHAGGPDPLAAGPAAVLPGEGRGDVPAAPRLGADTEQVLVELLGLSSLEIGKLQDAAVIALD